MTTEGNYIMYRVFLQTLSVVIGAVAPTLINDTARYACMGVLLFFNSLMVWHTLYRQPCNMERVNVILFAVTSLDTWSCFIGLFAIAYPDSMWVAYAWLGGAIVWLMFEALYVASPAVHNVRKSNETDDEGQIKALKAFVSIKTLKWIHKSAVVCFTGKYCSSQEKADVKEYDSIKAYEDPDTEIFSKSEKEVNNLSRRIIVEKDQYANDPEFDPPVDEISAGCIIETIDAAADLLIPDERPPLFHRVYTGDSLVGVPSDMDAPQPNSTNTAASTPESNEAQAAVIVSDPNIAPTIFDNDFTRQCM